uniref:C3H1-type domain-containing protein n=1 Tax=Tetradesmus obliquus TaxID=3088 RepID=A0A383W1P1_TETOB|eukprot:jgi/Sobl393_1/10018/SZX71577.1
MSSTVDDMTRSAEELMAGFKVLPCSLKHWHNWTTCFYLHPSERARRRNPLTHSYAAVMCPDMQKQGSCAKGDACSQCHNLFEYHMHPDRYRTVMCTDGAACQRQFCFFAHNATELRVPSSAAKCQAQDSMSQPASPQPLPLQPQKLQPPLPQPVQQQQQQQLEPLQLQQLQQLQQQLSLGADFSHCSSSWSTPQNSFELPPLCLTPPRGQAVSSIAAVTAAGGSSPCVVNTASAAAVGSSYSSGLCSMRSGSAQVDLVVSRLMEMQLQQQQQQQRQQHVVCLQGVASDAIASLSAPLQALGNMPPLRQQQQQQQACMNWLGDEGTPTQTTMSTMLQQQQQAQNALAMLQQMQYWKKEEASATAQLQAANSKLQGVLSLLQASHTDNAATEGLLLLREPSTASYSCCNSSSIGLSPAAAPAAAGSVTLNGRGFITAPSVQYHGGSLLLAESSVPSVTPQQAPFQCRAAFVDAAAAEDVWNAPGGGGTGWQQCAALQQQLAAGLPGSCIGLVPAAAAVAGGVSLAAGLPAATYVQGLGAAGGASGVAVRTVLPVLMVDGMLLQ